MKLEADLGSEEMPLGSQAHHCPPPGGPLDNRERAATRRLVVKGQEVGGGQALGFNEQ